MNFLKFFALSYFLLLFAASTALTAVPEMLAVVSCGMGSTGLAPHGAFQSSLMLVIGRVCVVCARLVQSTPRTFSLHPLRSHVRLYSIAAAAASLAAAATASGSKLHCWHLSLLASISSTCAFAAAAASTARCIFLAIASALFLR